METQRQLLYVLAYQSDFECVRPNQWHPSRRDGFAKGRAQSAQVAP